MATPDYYEDRGTLDKSDDYGLAELKNGLTQRFSSIQQMRYTVKIKDIITAFDLFSDVWF